MNSAVLTVALFWYFTLSGRAKRYEGYSDEELMKEYVSGNVKAFEALLSRYQKPIYLFLYRFIGDKEDASELFQETMLKLIRRADSFDFTQRFSTWLYVIARNTALDALRKQSKSPRIQSLNRKLRLNQDKELQDFIPDIHSREGEADSRAKELYSRLQIALLSLSPEQREVFLLRHHTGLRFSEIAKIIGCPVNTAKTRMRYALEKLRAELSDFIEETREHGRL